LPFLGLRLFLSSLTAQASLLLLLGVLAFVLTQLGG